MSKVIDHSLSTDSEAKTHAIIAYALLALGMFTAVPMLIGAIWAMIKRKTALGTIYHSHYTNSIRIFWWTLFWTIIGCILIFVVVGWGILAAVWIWALYRIINGFGKITADTIYPL